MKEKLMCEFVLPNSKLEQLSSRLSSRQQILQTLRELGGPIKTVRHGGFTVYSICDGYLLSSELNDESHTIFRFFKVKPKFRVGDKVFLSEDIIKYKLSNEGLGNHFPPSGVLDDEQSAAYDKAVCTALTLAMDDGIYGTIIGHNYPGEKVENFRILILGHSFLVEPKDLIKVED